MSLITHVIPIQTKPIDFCSSSEHKLRYFVLIPRAFWPSIDRNVTETLNFTQKSMKDIVKIVHLPSVVQSEFYEAMRILFVCKENKK